MYNETFWNQRYAGSDYVYGTEPNTFLAEHYRRLRAPVLSLAEGEGRNAVFLASQGLDVVCVDISAVALEKAKRLAQLRGVDITTIVSDLETFEPQAGRYGSVISVWAHLPSRVRQKLYPLLERSLQPDGIILLEAYAENQLSRDTGGPKDLDMLMTVEKLRQEFPNCEPLLLHEVERHVAEGPGHAGVGCVVQFIGRRRAGGG